MQMQPLLLFLLMSVCCLLTSVHMLWIIKVTTSYANLFLSTGLLQIGKRDAIFVSFSFHEDLQSGLFLRSEYHSLPRCTHRAYKSCSRQACSFCLIYFIYYCMCLSTRGARQVICAGAVTGKRGSNLDYFLVPLLSARERERGLLYLHPC